MDAVVKITNNVLTSQVEIVNHILYQLYSRVNDTLASVKQPVKDMIVNRVRELIMAAPEVNEIINGHLGKELGLANPGVAINDIVLAVQNSVVVENENLNVSGSGGLVINVLRADYQDILSLPHSSYITNKGVIVPWLQWLLLAGNTTVIYGYRVQINPHTVGTSRTGAIMVKTPGRAWGVPSQYAGTQGDNFLTRALMPLQNEINELVEKEFLQRIG